MLKSALIFSVCFVGVYCAMYQEMTTVTAKGKAEGYACNSSDTSLGLMKAGEVRTNYWPNSCIEASCASNGVIVGVSCGVVGYPPGCKLVSDYTKPYPDCCPEIVCN